MSVEEQDEILKTTWLPQLLSKAIEDNDQEGFSSILKLADTCDDDVKQIFNDRLYLLSFESVIISLLHHVIVLSVSHQAMYLEYIKGFKDHNIQYFRENCIRFLGLFNSISGVNDKYNFALSVLDPEDLLMSASLLEGWLSLAKKEGFAGFIDSYQQTLWCDELYRLLEQGDEHYNDGMIAIIRTLFETKTYTMTTLISAISHNNTTQYWPSICQQVIIDIINTKGLNEDTKVLFESLCEHALVPTDYFSKEDYHEVILQLISWYKEEVQRADKGNGLWSKQELSKMYGRLGIGLGITTNLTTGMVEDSDIDKQLAKLEAKIKSKHNDSSFREVVKKALKKNGNVTNDDVKNTGQVSGVNRSKNKS